VLFGAAYVIEYRTAFLKHHTQLFCIMSGKSFCCRSSCRGVLFCSPEVYTSNHKTELMDDAYDAVILRLGAAPSRQDSSKDLWVYDTDKQKWALAASASKMLAEHHKTFWAPLVSFAQGPRQHRPDSWCQHRLRVLCQHRLLLLVLC
jgi:hypothetical protein